MSKPANSPKKILLADDSVTMHRAVKLGLKKEPFDVICVDNGQDAWRITQSERPDAVLADLDMPGMTGAELCQKIKGDANLSHIPVILVCGSFDQIDEKELEKIPADARLWKPFETHVLTSLLAKLLGQPAGAVRETAEATAAVVSHRPPPPPPPPRGSPTMSSMEPTLSSHLHEPSIESGTRKVEMPSVQDQAESLLEGFQDIPLTNSTTSIEATELGLADLESTSSGSDDSYENLWDSPSVPSLPSEPTEMGGFEPTEILSTLPQEKDAPDLSWGSFDDGEKSFSNEVFEAVETRNFESDATQERSGAEVTEVLGGGIRDSSDDLPSFREETSQSFPPRPPASRPGSGSSPPSSLPPPPSGAKRTNSSLVDHSTTSATAALQNRAPGLSDEELRKIIREEIQTAIAGWLKNRLHDELDKVLEEIDRE